MATTTVKALAEELKRSSADLLVQLKAAGIDKESEADKITDKDKTALLAYLQKAHGSAETGTRKKITLTKRETSEIRQADSAGRTRTVQVEVRKKRVLVKRDEAANVDEPTEAKPVVAVETKPILSDEELEKRAAEAARQAELLARQEAEMKAASEAKQKKAETEQKPSKVDSEKEAASKEQAKKELAELQTRRAAAEREVSAIRDMMSTPARVLKAPSEIASEEAKKGTLHKPVKADGGEDKKKPTKVGGKLIKSSETSSTWQEEGAKRKVGLKTRGDLTGGLGGGWRTGGGRKKQQHQEDSPASNFQVPTEPIVRDVHIPETITVADLAHKMSVKGAEVIKLLMGMGQMVTINQVLDQDTAMIIVEEMGHKAHAAKLDDPEIDLGAAAEDAPLMPRPPVVTVMGHVDHGKTSLLDKIRVAKVAAGEAGGITQHIGAYHVETPKGIITFLDTPGHAAFTSMRARGAKATDIVVLVVAADDGVMPQTAEAIDHARAAGTPIIVAINKMDKESADVDRVLNELTTKQIVPEEWGGDVPIAKVSAHSGQGIDELLDLILIQSELMELKASSEGAAQGVVIEARVDKGRGAVTSILVQNGTLNIGDLVLAGSSYGRVRAMSDENGQPIKSAGPSIPVEILGLPDAPMAGDEVLVVNDEKKAREVADARADRERQKRIERQSAMRLENIMSSMGKKDVPTVNVVLKADVRGTLEALTAALNELSMDEVRVRVISSGVGAITESDVTLAESSEAVLLGFNVRADTTARQKSDQDGIDIRYYSIIYELIDDVKNAMSGKLAPEHRETILGVAEVREVFHSSKFGAAAGCMVLEGMLHRNKPIRVLRDDVVVFQGELESLRRYKDVVDEVRAGMECGLAVKGYKDIKVKDKIEVYDVQLIKRSL